MIFMKKSELAISRLAFDPRVSKSTRSIVTDKRDATHCLLDLVVTGIHTRHRELALSTVWMRSYPGVMKIRYRYRLPCHRRTT